MSIIGAFFALDKWAFSNKKKTHSIIFRLIRYNAICLISLGVNESFLISLTTYLEFFLYLL